MVQSTLLKKDYDDLWGPLSELLEKLSEVVALYAHKAQECQRQGRRQEDFWPRCPEALAGLVALQQVFNYIMMKSGQEKNHH